MRILFITLGVVLLILVAAVLVIGARLDDSIRSAVETHGPEYTGTEVKLDGVNLSIFDGAGEMKGLLVGQPPGYEGDAAMRVGQVRIVVDTSTLLEDTVVIRELVIDGAELNAVVRGLRDNNLQTILDHIESVTGPAEEPVPEQGPARELIIDRLAFTNARATATVGSMAPVQVSVPDLLLEDVGRDSGGATVGAVLQQVLRPVVAAVIRSAGEGRIGELLRSTGGDIGERLRESAGGLMDRLRGGLDGGTSGVSGSESAPDTQPRR